MHFAHTYGIYTRSYVFALCVRVTGCESPAGFNKRVGVAQRHPIITVIVDLSGAANHGGQDVTSELHSPPIQHTSYLNTRQSTYCQLFPYEYVSLSLPDYFCTRSTCLSTLCVVFPDVSLRDVTRIDT